MEFLQSSVTSSLFVPNMLLRSLFSDIKMCWFFLLIYETGYKWTGLNSIVRALLEGCRYHLDRENGWWLPVLLWWCDQYRRPPLQSQHVPLTSSNNWITTLLLFVFIHISRFSRDSSITVNVMESTSGWQRSQSGVVNCVFTLGAKWDYFVISATSRVSLKVSYPYVIVNSYQLYVLKDHCQNLDINGMIIWRGILKK